MLVLKIIGLTGFCDIRLGINIILRLGLTISCNLQFWYLLFKG